MEIYLFVIRVMMYILYFTLCRQLLTIIGGVYGTEVGWAPRSYPGSWWVDSLGTYKYMKTGMVLIQKLSMAQDVGMVRVKVLWCH